MTSEVSRKYQLIMSSLTNDKYNDYHNKIKCYN